jgi:hypothetical protein
VKAARSDGAALFAAFDLANHRSIAIPKSAQLLLIERSNERAKIEQRRLGLFGLITGRRARCGRMTL